MNSGGSFLGMENGKQHFVAMSEYRNSELIFCEIVREPAFLPEEVMLIRQLVNFLVSHIELIDYAETDTLTTLFNRKTFDEHLDRVLAETGDAFDADDSFPSASRRNITPGEKANWLAILDIDHFKRINDAYGHLIGDEVLVLVSRFMKESFRTNDRLFRYGGEEFIVILHATDIVVARGVLDRFRAIIENHEFPIVGKATISMGFTKVRYMDNPPDLLDRADKALYYAKENGRNRVESFEELQECGLVEEVQSKQDANIELF